ncbi:MAG: cytochrome C oxidase subunit IV family protein [Actinomycetota bacterium]
MEAEHVAHADELEHGDHPSARKYVFIAVFLAVITAIEVAIYYFDLSESLLVGGLLFFAFIKFVVVALYFMHLKFDNHLFRRLFVTGIVTALLVFTVVLVIIFAQGGPAPIVTGG